MKAQFTVEAIKTNPTIKQILIDLGLFINIDKGKEIDINGVKWKEYEVEELPFKALSDEDLGYILSVNFATFQDAPLWIEIDKSILDNEYTRITIEEEEIIYSYREYFQITEGQTKAILRLSDAPKNANGGISWYCSESTLIDVMNKTGSQVVLVEGEYRELIKTVEYSNEEV